MRASKVFILCPLSLLLLTGCKGSLSTLMPAGPAAEKIAVLWWVMLLGSAILTVLVMGLFALGFRRNAVMPSEKFWGLGMGVVFPLVILSALVTAGLWVGERILPRASDKVLRVQAEASQWQWTFTQIGPEGAPVSTRNRLYIPAGEAVEVEITSRDVVHSFWVPRLNGKMDAVPGYTNLLRIEANAPGEYAGRSAEFSGLGYGEMTFLVIAYAPDAAPPMISEEEVSP